MADELNVVLVGIGGYGRYYVNAVLDASARGLRVVGVVDPAPERCGRIDEIRGAKIPVFGTLEEFGAEANADLAFVATPIQLHGTHVATALSLGCSVLCEKPLCATVQEGLAMARARDEAGRIVAIGYQWSFSRAVQALKADILAGLYGKARRMRTIVHWPRGHEYYTRNSWAGAMRDPEGRLVLDGPVNNANAHSLHNMLYLLGDAVDRGARPARVAGELYRANDITNYDTAFVRCHTTEGAEVLLYCSHATRSRREVCSVFEFEKGTVVHGDGHDTFVGMLASGEKRDYGSPDDDAKLKVDLTVEAVRRGEPSLCGIEAAIEHTRCVNGLQEAVPEIGVFPLDMVRLDQGDDPRKYVPGLELILDECYREGTLPSEKGIPWARVPRQIDLTEYNFYPGGHAPGEA